MPGREIQAAQSIGNVPYIIAGAQKVGETFKKGALLVVDVNGFLAECGADPILVTGVALQAADSNPGFQAANSPATFTGRSQTVSYVVADLTTTYTMRGVNGGTDPVTPLQTNVGESYGALKDANGIWTLDLAEVTVLIFDIVGFDALQKLFICKFNPAALV